MRNKSQLKPRSGDNVAWLGFGLILVFLLTGGTGAQTVPKPQAEPPLDTALLNQYCITCHNQRAKTGGLALDTLDYDHLDKNGETWEKVIRKIKTGMMPPSGM